MRFVVFEIAQDYQGVLYPPGTSAPVPRDIPPKVAARWVAAGIARWNLDGEVPGAIEETSAEPALGESIGVPVYAPESEELSIEADEGRDEE